MGIEIGATNINQIILGTKQGTREQEQRPFYWDGMKSFQGSAGTGDPWRHQDPRFQLNLDRVNWVHLLPKS